ncbi:serine protease snake-like [Sitophilus oryzae]|uniref:Serine protease snake-like n=1 Tax=Sitophilus oryzae TaxID=7048 RepID=A0A6J2Y2J2_SITOR|nr:serine protease snake-like [Sitophilus oryzae]
MSFFGFRSLRSDKELIKMIKKNILSFLLVILHFSSVKTQKIAQEKCAEYGQAVYQAETVPFFRSSGRTKMVSTCTMYDNTLIVGGKAARIKEFPHMAAIGFGTLEGEEIMWLCGGSLISEKHVLTAAHCTISRRGPPRRVRLGMVDLFDNSSYIQEKSVEKFVNHPQYKRPRKYHDIAIVFLESPVIFTPFVRPACVNTLENINQKHAQAIGFGKRFYDDNDRSTTLLKVKLPLFSNEVCSKYILTHPIEMPNGLIDSEMCAGDLDGGRDTCEGDSGGPLQVVQMEPYCTYSIIGVTSFGRFCGMKNSLGVYSKVDQFVPWIESVIWQ